MKEWKHYRKQCTSVHGDGLQGRRRWWWWWGYDACVCVYIHISVYLGGDEAEKVIKIQWLGEREEGGQRGTEDGILSLYVPRRLSLSQHDSSVSSFSVFIYLPSVHFSSIVRTFGPDPGALRAAPPPPLPTPPHPPHPTFAPFAAALPQIHVNKFPHGSPRPALQV